MDTIEIVDLTKRFDDVVAVDRLSFTARAGRVTGFLGPNGSGKTTTLRMLLGLVRPTAGTARIDGRAYAHHPDPPRLAGAVLDSMGFHPGRRAQDHLISLAIAAGIPRSRVAQVLAEVGLTDVARRRAKGFSLGMRQRLAIAAALLGDPKVLILDEPANGLDPEGMNWLRSLLRRLADSGGTVLVSSHVLAEVAQTVDDVVIIDGGKLVLQSSLADLSRQWSDAVRVRTPQRGSLEAALQAARARTERVGDDTLLVFGLTAEAVALTAAGVGAAVYEIGSAGFDLEAMFLDLTSPQEASA